MRSLRLTRSVPWPGGHRPRHRLAQVIVEGWRPVTNGRLVAGGNVSGATCAPRCPEVADA